MTYGTIYTPVHVILRHVDVYELPRQQEDVLLRSLVNRQVLNQLRRLLRALFPDGRVRNGRLSWNNIIVALEEVVLEHIGITLQPGEWIDMRGYWRGRDLIELVACCWRIPYASAVQMIANHLGFATGNHPCRCDEKVSGWVQERNPLRPFFDETFNYHGPEWFAYRNMMGTIFALCRKVPTQNAEVFSVFKTIVKNERTGGSFVVEAFPEKPYHLYRLDRIATNVNAPVVIVQDERAADASQRLDVVFAAVPGGLDNFLDADLTCLKERKVSVHLRRQDVCRGRLIERKLRDAKVSEMYFILDDGKARSFNELDAIAGKLGIEVMLEPEACVLPDVLDVPDLGTFLATDAPPRKWILKWIIPEKGLVMIHAPRGVGKTHVALGIAYACATGTRFLNWCAPTAHGVLYLDGEMSASDLQERLKAIASGEEIGTATNLRILNPDLLDRPMPDLSTDAGQKAIEPLLAGVSLIIIDNLATLCRSGNENDGESWLGIQGWLLDLRRRRISVLLIHHSGKNGGQRGTSRREDILDTVIRLQRPADYDASEGARFEVHLTKARQAFGHAAKPFEASLTTNNGKAEWVTRDIVDSQLEKACELFEQNVSVRKVASVLGIPKSAAGRLRRRLADEGWLTGEARANNDDES